MSAQRAARFKRVCDWVGPVLQPLDAGEGWPGLARLIGSPTDRLVALHVSLVTDHSRAPHEFRFQNPDNAPKPANAKLPVAAPNHSLPILVGTAEHDGQQILVVADGTSRLGVVTRFSILFDIAIVAEAAVTGWSEYVSSTGERIVALQPRLLPAFVEALAHNVSLDVASIENVAAASGILDDPSEDSFERARVAVTRLVRRAAFGKEVCAAYQMRCAMCGISLNLLEGAHIYPATAPGSTDHIWNGLALCRNHHRLFDRHRIWVSPDDGRILWHPEILGISDVEPAAANFVQNTHVIIAMPTKASQRPRPEMFVQRYEFAGGQYEWAN